MKTSRKKNNLIGSTHTFIFTHAPIVNGTIDIGGPMDATHKDGNDYAFVDWVMNIDPTQRPYVEAVFCGHTHTKAWDSIHGLYGKYPGYDRDIDWDGISTASYYYYTDDLLDMQMPKSTG